MNRASSYTTEGDKNNLSVKYNNIYAIDGQLYYFSLSPVDLPITNKFTNAAPWKPIVKLFKNEREISEYLITFDKREEIELSVIGDNWWYGNIAHALFDGLYPIYVALVKFGYASRNFVLLSSDWDNKKTMSYDVMTKFCGSPIMEYNKLDRSKLYCIKTLIAGTGMTGNRVVNKDYTLYGQNEYNALTLFKNRMLSAYDLSVDKPINSKLKVIIIKNKRFSPAEEMAIGQILHIYKNKLDIKYIDWHHDYSSFADQMKEIENVDIQITCPGTAMLYLPFLKRGAVNINLGYIEKTQTNSARPNIFIKESKAKDHILPGWLEQSVCAATDYVTTLYYDRATYNNLETAQIASLIDQAIKIIEDGKILEDRHHTDAHVFIEYCKRVDNAEELCKYLTSIAFFIELFVNEHPYTLSVVPVDIELLRKIKDEYGFNRQYEIKL